jgi:acyl carrier protein
MNRDEVLELIRTHLAEELGIDPARIEPATRFREDLAVDSLDLYTVIQELEDTYGIAISDEQAIRLQTVEATVDFVLSHAADR